MADKEKLDIEVVAHVTGDKTIEALDRKIAKLEDRVAGGDPKAIKAQKALVNQKLAYIEAQKLGIRTTKQEIDGAVKLEGVKDKAETRAIKRAKEKRLAKQAESNEINRAENKAESARRREETRERGVIASILRSSRAKRDAVLASIDNGKRDLSEIVKRWGTVNRLEKLESDLRAKRHTDRVNDVQYLEKLRNRSLANIDRANAKEKSLANTQNRQYDNQRLALNRVGQFINRQTGLIDYRGNVERRHAANAMKDLRSNMAANLLRFRADQKNQRASDAASGQYDTVAHQRIQNRLKASIASARKDFNAKVEIGRKEQNIENARVRESDRIDRERTRNRAAAGRQTMTSANRMLYQGKDALQAATIPAKLAMAGAAATGIAVKHGIDSRMEVDKAETNLRIYGGMGTNKLTQEDVTKDRKGFLDKMAIKNGLSPAGAINAFTDVLKADIPAHMAREVTQMIMDGVSGSDLPLDETTKLVSRLNYLKPNLGVQGLKRGLNDVSVAGAITGADPNELVSSMRRGAGAMTISPNLGFGDLAALTGVGISTGVQSGQAGTFIEHQLRHAATAKYQSKHRRDELKEGYRLLDMGSLGTVQKDATENGAEFLERLFTNLNKLAKVDINKANKAADFIGGEYWTKDMMMYAAAAESTTDRDGVMRNNKLRNALQGVRNDGGNHLDQSNQIKMDSWGGRWKSTMAVFSLFWDSFGRGFDGILKDITGYFRTTGANFNFDQITNMVAAGLEGVKAALGIDTWKQGLEELFGKGDKKLDSIANLRDIRKFFKGLTEGFMEIVYAFKGIMSAFGIDTNSSITMGKWAGRIIALSIALLALSPVLGILGGVVSLVLALASAATAISGIIKLAQLAGLIKTAAVAGPVMNAAATAATVGGAATTAAGAAATASTLGNGIAGPPPAVAATQSMFGRMMSTLNKAFLPVAVATTMSPKQGDIDSMIGRILKSKGLISGTTGTAPNAPNSPAPPTEQQRLIEETNRHLEQLNQTVDDTARFQRQSYQESGGTNGLIQKAAMLTGSTAAIQLGNLRNSGGTNGGLERSGSFSSSAGPLANSAPGERLNGGGGLGYRGIIGGAGSARGAGAGAGAGMPMGSRLGGGNAGNYNFGNGPGGAPLGSRMDGYGANPGAYKPALDYIAKAEGTSHTAGGGYNTSLGYGKFLPGGVEHKLTDMTLDQISALGHHMRQQRGNPNSSALGRYQIVGKTMRGLMTKMGLSGNEKFDEAMQDRMGAELVRQRGADPRGLGQEWASLTGRKGMEAASIVGQIPRGSSTVPGARPADVAGSAILSSNGSQFDDGAGLNITGAMRNLRAQGAVMNEQCVSLVKAAAGSSESVRTWQRGVQATDGTLKPGMAVATFMDAAGRQSARYAGGGTGTMGANRDHAGIFQEYIKDAAGKNIGMRIAEQYKGSGGVASKDYMFGRGTGAKDGANYAGVLDQNGNVMGMRRPPGATMSSPYTTPGTPTEPPKDPYSFNGLKTPEQIAKETEAKKSLDAFNKFDGFDKSKIFSVPKDGGAPAVASGGTGWKTGLGPMAEAALKKQQEEGKPKEGVWTEGWGSKGKPYSLLTPAEKLAKQKEDAKNPAYAPGSKIPRAADFNSASSPEEDAEITSRMLKGMSAKDRVAYRKREYEAFSKKYPVGSELPKASNFDSGKGKLPQRILDQFKKDDAAKKISDAIVSGAVKSATGVADAIKKPNPTIASDIEKQADTLKSSGWKPKAAPSTPSSPGGTMDTSGKGGPIVQKASLGDNAPTRQPNIQPQMTQAAAKGGGGSSGGGAGGATINVNGAGMSAEAVANAVQRKLNSDTGTRTHDIDHTYA